MAGKRQSITSVTQSTDELPRHHILTVPDRPFEKYFCLLLLILVICPFILDPPLLDKPFSPAIVKLAQDVLVVDLVLLVAGAVYLSFYRKKMSIILDEKGIQVQGKKLIPWKNIIWYQIDIFSSKGVRRAIVKAKDQKVAIAAEDGQALIDFEKDLKNLIPFYNPMAKNYKETASSKNWGYFFIFLVTAIYLGLVTYFELRLVYTLLLAPEILFIIMMIYIEKIRGRPWSLEK